MLVTNYSIPNKDLAESDLRSLRKINEITTSAQLEHFDVVKDKILCFDNYNMELLFEVFHSNLETLKSQKLEEAEVWLIIGDLLSYLNDMQQLSLSHGDLQPQFVYRNQANQTKIVAPLLFTEYQNAYKYRLANENYKSAYAPELLAQFKHRTQFPQFDPVKADIFSLGICILSLTSNTNYQNFYDFLNNDVKIKLIQEKLAISVQ